MTKDQDLNTELITPCRPGESGDSGMDVVGLRPLTREEMVDMDHAALVSHAWRMQKAYTEMESDSRFLTWELREVHDSITNFSRAAKLAHQLNASDLDTIAAISTMELPSYFRCRFAALFVFGSETRLFELMRSNQELPDFEHDPASSNFLFKLLTAQAQPFLAEYSEGGTSIELDSGELLSTDKSYVWFKQLGKALVFPLRGKKYENQEPVVLGGLILGDAQPGLDVKDAEFAALFGDLLSSSLYNAQLVQKLNDLIIVDPLTQLFNRRHIFNQLESVMAQARRHGHHLSLAMVDIDMFKRFNDVYGHICGDEVLREVADVIKTSVRFGVDIPARYGGEEFILVMPFTALDIAVDVADRIRRQIKNHVVDFEGLRLSATCSFGVAEYIPGETAERFIERADMSLYQAKKTGRDRVCAAEVYEKPASFTSKTNDDLLCI